MDEEIVTPAALASEPEPVVIDEVTPADPVDETPAPEPIAIDPEPVIVTVTPVIEDEPPLHETVVLETDHGRTVVHIPDFLGARQPSLLMRGVSWYHKTEDADGRWVYRKD